MQAVKICLEACDLLFCLLKKNIEEEVDERA